MRDQWIRWLADCADGTPESVGQVGNKMAGLGEMLRLGLRIPNGFVVARQAYDDFLAATGLRNAIRTELARADGDPVRLQRAAGAIRQRIESAAIPPAITSAIAGAYRALADLCGVDEPEVAVRSSATAEDMPEASFAGQQDTYLGIRGADAVLASIRRCWASLFCDRALAYRNRMGYPLADVSMAVGVQKLVNARAAGVMFTINPVTGNPFEMVLEGNWGLGESVVSGMITPDRFVVRKRDLLVTTQEAGWKTQAIYPAPGGTQMVDLPPDRQSSLCLSPVELEELARLGRQLESHYGEARDVEWAVDGDLPFPDAVVLLQVRPVTTVGLKDWQGGQNKSAADHIVDLILRKRFGGSATAGRSG